MWTTKQRNGFRAHPGLPRSPTKQHRTLKIFCGHFEVANYVRDIASGSLLVFSPYGVCFSSLSSPPPSVDYQSHLFPAICCLLTWCRIRWRVGGGCSFCRSSGCTVEEKFHVNYPHRCINYESPSQALKRPICSRVVETVSGAKISSAVTPVHQRAVKLTSELVGD